jgi:hypothetical protein
MITTSVHCPVSGAYVTEVIDFEGRVERLICNDFDVVDGSCRLRKIASAGGPLAQLLERTAEHVSNRGTACILRSV